MSDLDEIQKPSLTRVPSMVPSTVPAEFLKPGPVKVIFLGDCSVGKSCIINYLVNGITVCQEIAKVTVAGGPRPFGRVRVSTRKGDVTFMLWDTCGSEKYFAVGRQFMRGSNAVVFVYDISEFESFESLFKGNNKHRSWLDEFLIHWSDQEKELLPIVILGNKADDEYEHRRCPELQTNKVEQRLTEEAESRKLKPFLFWETSALTGKNLNEFSEVLGECFPSNIESWQSGSHFDDNNAVVVHGAEEKKHDEGKDHCKCRN